MSNETQELIINAVTYGDLEYDTIPEHELIQLHASEVGVSMETEDLYLLKNIEMVERGILSIYDIFDRRVNSIIRRRLGIPTSLAKSIKYLALKDPYAVRARNIKLQSCNEIYMVKFYRVDERPAKDVPMEVYEYIDDRKSAEAHFERFRSDRSLLYTHIELTVDSSKFAEKVIKTIRFVYK